MYKEERRRIYDKDYRERHPDRIREKCRRYESSHRPRRNHMHRPSKYGLTISAYEAILLKQGGACAICRSTDWGAKGPTIDHDHKTGMVRGILCQKCNTTLGNFNDSAAMMRLAIEYLEDPHV